MATYILFWNPEISSYTRERFLGDFTEQESVGNWSFYEHEKVKPDDTFFMVKCGGGRTGIVMRGIIASRCYEDCDWSPRNRKHIFYADIETGVCINPWSEAPMITTEQLTEAVPGFDWTGGHSGRRLEPASARKLEKLWFEYLDGNQQMLANNEAWIDLFVDEIISDTEAKKLANHHGQSCEICGYSYEKIFGPEDAKDYGSFMPRIIRNPALKRLFFIICDSCYRISDNILERKLIELQERQRE